MSEEDDKKLFKKFREAERMRKERERTEDTMQRQRLERQTATALKEAHHQRQRYEGIARNVKTLPEDYMANVVSAMVFQIVRDMVADDSPIRFELREVVEAFMENTIIRVDPHSHSGRSVHVEINNERLNERDEPTITVRIPEFRLTNILSPDLAESLTGGRGPVVMPDKPLHVVSIDSTKVSYDDPHAPVATKVEII